LWYRLPLLFLLAFWLSIGIAETPDLKMGSIESDDPDLFRTFYRKRLSPVAVTNLGSGVVYYFVSRGGPLGAFDYEKREYLGGWPLTRWPYLNRVPEIVRDHENVGIGEWKQRIEYTAHHPDAGCLNHHPLRYGDIEDDGENEIVLLLNGEFIVFSPAHGRTIFSAFVDASDWFRELLEELTLESDVEDDVAYQYLSEHLIYNGIRHRAHRSYTKVFTGDFDKDSNPDILTWQKVYVSNKMDEASGFHLVRNELKHFERDLKTQQESAQGVTGEYLPQETEEATLQQWFAENELTWKKGFPSVSECAGEQGQPIGEMHDPLLNDPDVLK